MTEPTPTVELETLLPSDEKDIDNASATSLTLSDLIKAQSKNNIITNQWLEQIKLLQQWIRQQQAIYQQ